MHQKPKKFINKHKLYSKVNNETDILNYIKSYYNILILQIKGIYMEILKTFGLIIKFPFFQIFKLLIITPLNFFPSKVWEVHGIRGNNEHNRPDLRANHTLIKGNRRLKFGCALIAYLKGSIIKAHINSNGTWCWGIYEEDYKKIIEKWTY